MKISELILHLEKLRAQHGDVACVVFETNPMDGEETEASPSPVFEDGQILFLQGDDKKVVF